MVLGERPEVQHGQGGAWRGAESAGSGGQDACVQTSEQPCVEGAAELSSLEAQEAGVNGSPGTARGEVHLLQGCGPGSSRCGRRCRGAWELKTLLIPFIPEALRFQKFHPFGLGRNSKYNLHKRDRRRGKKASTQF